MPRDDVFYGASGYGDTADAQRFVLWGSGSPQSAVTADVSALYMDIATGNVWSKTSGSGNTGWTQLAAVGSAVATSQAVVGFGVYNGNSAYGTVAPATSTAYAVAGGGSEPYRGVSCAFSGSVVAVAGHMYRPGSGLAPSTFIASGSIDFYVYKNGAALTPAVSLTNASLTTRTNWANGTYTFAADDELDVFIGATSLTTGTSGFGVQCAVWVQI